MSGGTAQSQVASRKLIGPFCFLASHQTVLITGIRSGLWIWQSPSAGCPDKAITPSSGNQWDGLSFVPYRRAAIGLLHVEGSMSPLREPT